MSNEISLIFLMQCVLIWSISSRVYFFIVLDRIGLQVRGFEQLDERLKLKIESRNNLKTDIEELNKSIVNKQEQIRSQYEIEAIRNDIRNLTNEKAKLEMKYSKRKLKFS